MDIIDEQIDTLGRTFMGLTLGCARCHDHKFDPVTTDDYYSLAGIFKSTKTMENFSVVARWQERPLAAAEDLKRQETQQKKIDEKKSAIDQITGQANNRLLSEERKYISTYLLAAEDQRQRQKFLEQVKPVGATANAKTLPGLVIIEAEKFARGNVKRDFTDYGKGIGVIFNKGEYPNFAEYDLVVPGGGLFQLEIRYAAAAARPVKLSINGELVKPDAAGKTTGSWFPDTQTWMVQGVFPFKAGKNTIRLERQQPFPHFDKLLVVPARRADGRPLALPGSTNQAHRPKREFVSQFVAYLQKSRSDAKSPLAIWNRFVAGDGLSSVKPSTSDVLKGLLADPRPTSLVQLADRYGKLFADIDRDWQIFQRTDEGKSASGFPDPQQESLRWVLYDTKGPFALPKNPEPYYSAEIRGQLRQRREQVKSLKKLLPKFPVAMAVSEGKPQNLRIHIRGSHTTLGEEVPRRFLQIIAGEDQSPIDNQRSGRLELARWLGSPDHPLTARVMVNRIWLWHFGEGLIRSPDNIGRLGERPTHPQLLDWLAVRFVEEGWSIKAMHRLIMLSATYQMSTAYQAKPAESDPDNRLLWRMNRRRLEAEAVRDAIIAIAGNLDLTMGGSLLPTENRKYVTSTANINPVVYKTNRRSIYLPVVRSALYDVFRAFDFSDPSVPSGKRAITTVAPQALFMMNSELVSEQTKTWATRLLADADLDEAARVRQVFERSYSRPPTQRETDRALAYIGQYDQAMQAAQKTAAESRLRAWQSFCRVIIASNEFMYIE
jgi:hypothetical protein